MKFRPLSTFRKKDNTKKEAVPKAATKQRNGKKKKYDISFHFHRQDRNNFDF